MMLFNDTYQYNCPCLACLPRTKPVFSYRVPTPSFQVIHHSCFPPSSAYSSIGITSIIVFCTPPCLKYVLHPPDIPFPDSLHRVIMYCFSTVLYKISSFQRARPTRTFFSTDIYETFQTLLLLLLNRPICLYIEHFANLFLSYKLFYLFLIVSPSDYLVKIEKNSQSRTEEDFYLCMWHGSSQNLWCSCLETYKLVN